MLIQRIEDEQVRRALARSCGRETVAAVIGVTPRTILLKRKRGDAYDLPLDGVRDGRSASPPGSRDDGGSNERSRRRRADDQ